MPRRSTALTTKQLIESGQTKICRSCHRERPVVDYLLQRHKICVHCRIRNREKAAAWHADTPPPAARDAGLSSTRAGRAKYARELYRRKRMRDAMLNPTPPPRPTNPPRIKWCRRCKQYKPAREFENYRVRVCLMCDGPTAPWVAPMP